MSIAGARQVVYDIFREWLTLSAAYPPPASLLSDSGTTNVDRSSSEAPNLLVRSILTRRCLFSKPKKELLHDMVLEYYHQQKQAPFKANVPGQKPWLLVGGTHTCRLHATNARTLGRSHRSFPSPAQFQHNESNHLMNIKDSTQ